MGRPLFRADDDGSYATLPHDVVANKELLRTLHEMQIKVRFLVFGPSEWLFSRGTQGN